jgi:hypothetical protein
VETAAKGARLRESSGGYARRVAGIPHRFDPNRGRGGWRGESGGGGGGRVEVLGLGFGRRRGLEALRSREGRIRMEAEARVWGRRVEAARANARERHVTRACEGRISGETLNGGPSMSVGCRGVVAFGCTKAPTSEYCSPYLQMDHARVWAGQGKGAYVWAVWRHSLFFFFDLCRHSL